MEVESPASGSDEPGNGHTTTVCVELVAALAAEHRIYGTAAIELRATFAEAEECRIFEQKRDGAGFRIDGELLNCVAPGVLDDSLKRIHCELDAEFADFNDVLSFGACEFCQRRPPGGLHQRAIAFDGLRSTFFQWKDAEPKSVGAHRGHLNFYGTTGDLKILLRGFCFRWPQEISCADGADSFQNVAAIVTVSHLVQHPEENKDFELFPEKRSRDYTRKYGR